MEHPYLISLVYAMLLTSLAIMRRTNYVKQQRRWKKILRDLNGESGDDQGMVPEYSSDEAGDGPDSFGEYFLSDRKAKRRLNQRKYKRKRRNQRIEAQHFRRSANPTVRAIHNASAHTARDTNATK